MTILLTPLRFNQPRIILAPPTRSHSDVGGTDVISKRETVTLVSLPRTTTRLIPGDLARIPPLAGGRAFEHRCAVGRHNGLVRGHVEGEDTFCQCVDSCPDGVVLISSHVWGTDRSCSSHRALGAFPRRAGRVHKITPEHHLAQIGAFLRPATGGAQ